MKFMKDLRALTAFLIACLILTIGCIGHGEFVPVDKNRLRGSGEIYLVPMGDFPADSVADLITFYQAKYGLDIETLPAVAIRPTAINPERKQLSAEYAVSLMKAANSALVKKPEEILIGLTTIDMYIEKYDWQFSFSWRQEGRYAVVSTGRMQLGSVGREQELSRLRKMVTKNIGILYFRLPQSDHPRSVLYKSVGGISELDYMSEEF
jgi:predicted Zn-dependent protease